jgi:hypothetical protein
VAETTLTAAVIFIPVVVATEFPMPKLVAPPFIAAVQTYAVGVAVHERVATVPVVASAPATILIVPRKLVHVAVEQVVEVIFVPGVMVAVEDDGL